MIHPLTKEIRTKIREAIKEFGTYSYEDKGPHDVMDVGELEDKLKKLPGAELKIVFNELGQTKLGAIFTEAVYEILDNKMVSDLQATQPSKPIHVVKLSTIDELLRGCKKG